MAQSITGLASTLDTDTIVTQLMKVERATQDRLSATRTTAQSRITALQGVSTKVAALRSLASALATSASWNLWAATSSDATRVGVRTTSGANGGSLSFTVDALARAHSMVSSATVGSTAAVVATGPVLLAKDGASVGFTSFAAGAGLALGAHTIAVTQASGAAQRVGTSALAVSTTITTGLNDTLDVTINGVARTLTLTAGTYTRAQLASAVAAASTGDLTATVDGTNTLNLATTREGSTASIQVTGGTARVDLGLAIDGAAATGTDGIVTVDGTANTLTNLTAGASVALTSGTGGTIDAVLAGGVRSGTRTATNVGVGDGSLGAVVAAVNGANAGVIATAVQVGAGAYRLQLESTTTGAASSLAIAPGQFTGLGTLGTLTAAGDAQLTVGSGPNAYTLTSATNSVSNVLSGVTLDLWKADAGITVTVQVQRDTQGAADNVQGLVNAVNAVVSEIKRLTAYDSTKNTASLLTGDSTLRRILGQLTPALTAGVSTSTLGSAGLAGLSVNRDGTFAFDAAKFSAAYQANPDAVASLFSRGGTATDAKVTFSSATAATLPGTYAVTVTTAPERAEKLGAVVGGGAITAPETIDLQVGATTATYAASASETLTSIAAGLNAAVAAKGLALVATVESGALVVRSTGYGAAVTFDVRTSAVGAGQTGLAALAATWEPHTGVNVAGSINGVAATGVGQLLQGPVTDATLGGLSLVISATPADVALSTNFGTFTYVPGVAARTEAVARSAADPVTGALTTDLSGTQTRVSDLDKAIAAWDVRLKLREASLRKKYLAMETALGLLKSQGDRLASQLAQLSASTKSS